MAEHTPGRVRFSNGHPGSTPSLLLGAQGEWVAHGFGENHEADLQRLAILWNACLDIPTKSLEIPADAEDPLVRLRRLRQAVVAAHERAVDEVLDKGRSDD